VYNPMCFSLFFLRTSLFLLNIYKLNSVAIAR
jgi:hypothetical protein